MMNRSTLFLVFIWMMILCNVCIGAESLPAGCEKLGEVFFQASTLSSDKTAMRRLDAMVPMLMKAGKSKVIRIEGNYPLAGSKDERITKSLNLAKEVEQYLRTKHSLVLDLYLAAQDDTVGNDKRQSVRIVIYPNEFEEIKL